MGEIVHYSYQVTNQGNVTLTDITVTDTPTPPAGALTTGPTCPLTTLAVGEGTTCTATYTVTAADIAHGSIVDTAVASGDPPTGTAVDSAPSEATVEASAITVVKSASPASVAKAGEQITYRYLVTNSGDDQLTGLHITDTQTARLDRSPPDPPARSPPSPRRNDHLHRQLHPHPSRHRPRVRARLGRRRRHRPRRRHRHLAALHHVGGSHPNPRISVAKTATPASVSQVGQVIDYHYLVTNTGNVTLTNVHVTDTQTPPPAPSPPDPPAPSPPSGPARPRPAPAPTPSPQPTSPTAR